MRKGYTNDFFRQFEELHYKLDSLLEENEKLKSEHKEEIKKLTENFKNEISSLNNTIKELIKSNNEKDKQIEKLLEERDKYKNNSNKNSSNSSKPSSTDMIKPKKSGANLYNSRCKTNAKVGGQKGHKGYGLTKEKVENIKAQNNVKEKTIEHIIKGNSSNKPIIKYRIGMAFTPYIEKHVFIYDKDSNDVLPKEFYTDVTYTNELKSLIVFMNVHNVLSVSRLTEFFSVISNGIINLSQGTVINIMAEFSKKSTPSVDNIIEDVLKDKTMFTDETVQKLINKNGYVRNYSNEDSVVYKSHFNKGHIPIKEDDILTRFTGIVMGDHDTTLNSYGSKRIECNVHLGRYTVEITQNTFEAPWAERMKTLLETGNNTKKYAEMYGMQGFVGDNYAYYSNKYDEIIQEAKEETKQIKSTFYRNKSKTLYTRLEKDKEKHLAFLKDFSLPYSNNLSESDLRVYKIKVKVSGGFRSKKGSDYFADALSIIKTSKKRKQNVMQNILNIFNGQTLFA